MTRAIRDTLEGKFAGFWVEGEISNHRCPSSGHHYFTLKDAGAQLSVVLFRGQAQFNRVELADGIQVQVFGRISVYENRGQYQLVAEWVQPKGLGQLQAKFEALKAKLDAEGLFHPAKKIPIPVFPRTLTLVTSPTGAALQDMLNVLKRRAPWMRILIMPVPVQGQGAENEIASAIRWLSAKPKSLPEIDTLIVARGGGSLEDLWNFNEEIVARAISDCPIPVITGVGHEIDFTIADFVADRREPTPSAAAENAVPDGIALNNALDQMNDTLEYRVENVLHQMMQSVDWSMQAFEGDGPETQLDQFEMEIDFLHSRLNSQADETLSELNGELRGVSGEIDALNPRKEIEFFSRELERAREGLELIPETALSALHDRLENQNSLLNSSSPTAILKRGFSITQDTDGNSITDPDDVESGETIQTTVAAGTFKSVVSDSPKDA